MTDVIQNPEELPAANWQFALRADGNIQLQFSQPVRLLILSPEQLEQFSHQAYNVLLTARESKSRKHARTLRGN